MSRLPDRFDLWIRRARACADFDRQADFILGALAALPAWHFLDTGPAEQPTAATTELDGARHLLVFSGAERLLELLPSPAPELTPVLALPPDKAFAWVLALPDVTGLLINPGEDACAVSLDRVRTFHDEWQARRDRHPTGFWIPNLTSEEEDFWQEHGL